MAKKPAKDYSNSPYVRTLPDGTQQVQCRECGTWVSSLRHTHFKGQHCTGNIKNNDEYRAKYPDSPVFPPSLSQKVAVTEARMIESYGEEEGRRRWQEYCSKQADTNSFEYKQAKLGWTREQFDEYNASRAVTLENLVKKHGQTRGQEMYDQYVERQRYTTSLDYFIKEYGEQEGTEKFNNFNRSRGTISAPEQSLFDKLKPICEELEQQVIIDSLVMYRPFDMGIKSKKKLIEFYGTYFHCDARKFSKDYYNEHLKKTAEQAWKYDEEKNLSANKLGYDVLIVREMDWIADPQQVIKNVEHWLNTPVASMITEQHTIKINNQI